MCLSDRPLWTKACRLPNKQMFATRLKRREWGLRVPIHIKMMQSLYIFNYCILCVLDEVLYSNYIALATVPFLGWIVIDPFQIAWLSTHAPTSCHPPPTGPPAPGPCMYIYIYLYKFIYTHIHIYMCVCIYIYRYMHLFSSLSVYIYIQRETCI